MIDIKLYQINMDRDEDEVAFLSLDKVVKKNSEKGIDPEIYDLVFEGEVPVGNLEQVYTLFNIDHLDGYKGRSLSVSDVVKVEKSEQISPGFYYCDTIGFKAVDFDETKTSSALTHKIRVVMVEPGRLAKEEVLNTDLINLQRAVGGYIETYYPFDEEVCIVCNEEGKLNGMPLNRAIYGDNKEIIDIIAGPFFICDSRDPDFGSLSDEQIKKYTKMFRYPELFYREGGKIKAESYKPIDPSKDHVL